MASISNSILILPSASVKSPTFLLPKTSSSSSRILMLARSQPIRIPSSINIQKVFEDKSRGIVCYLDDKGEITCEGYDEGPRQPSRFSRGEQHQHIVDLLKRSLLLQATDGASKLN